MPNSTKEPKGILGLDLLFFIVSRKSSSILNVFFKRVLAALKYFFSFSIP